MPEKTNRKIPSLSHFEEKTRLLVPRQSFSAPHHSLVFFNPAMRFSRSMGSLAVGVLKPKNFLDGFCATGARGLRAAVENPSVRKISFVDANPDAVEFVEENIRLNTLSPRARAFCFDFDDFCLQNEGKFDFVEIDPFGTPAPFVVSALTALKKAGGVLSSTSTDLANLVKKIKPTMRDYGAKPLYNDFSHETALRILLGFLARKAFEKGLSFSPLVCFYELHYVKVIARIGRRRETAAQFGKKLGFISYCDSCLARFTGKKSKCNACRSRLLYAGPLWLGDYCDSGVVRKMLALNEKRGYSDGKRIGKTLSLLEGEQGKGFPPWFYDIHYVADKFGLAAEKKIDAIVESLRAKGFKAVKTHFTPTGVKTNAGIKELLGVFS